ncbi:MAG: GHKL domain-containing protein [Ruminococcaceae bacterium]|nr:GHKL domain-containing protein [Oscillospiraceae bacterium]
MIFTIAEYFTAFFEALMFYLFLDTFCGKRKNIINIAYYLTIVLLTLFIIVVNHVFSYTILNVIFIVVSVFLTSFMFKGSIPTRAIISIIAFLIASSMEVVILFIITSVYRVSATVAIENPSLRLLGIILSKMLGFTLINIICMIAKRKKIRLGKSYWVMFLLVFINSTLAVFLLYKLAYESSITHMNYLLMICSFGLFLSAFFSFYMCERMAKQNEIINKQQQYEQQLQSQSKHLDDILVNQEELRKFRHDISNHLTTINGFFEATNNEDGKKYISSISELLVDNTERIKTGNTAFDAIINTKKALAESKGIEFCTNIKIPTKLNIDATDICIIFGNALDNAIEACERYSGASKKISLDFIYENNSVLCKIINSAQENNGSNLKTHKKDKLNHGIGLENIKTAVSKYDGSLHKEYKDGLFILKFVMFV